jgi:hypothetical protein
MQPKDKPNSLVFSIDREYYKTNVSSNTINTNMLDMEINKEMDVIITVLNRLFDETDTDYYIGDNNKLVLLNNNVNNVLNNINTHSVLISRKNKGTKTILGRDTNKPNFTTNRHIFNMIRKNKMTRKAHKYVN